MEFECQECHHETEATELRFPHEDYFDDFWIDCTWLEPVALPGGAAAIRQPWRMALSYLFATYGNAFLELGLPFMKDLNREQIKVILQMIERNLNAPLTSSRGRLFDRVESPPAFIKHWPNCFCKQRLVPAAPPESIESD